MQVSKGENERGKGEINTPENVLDIAQGSGGWATKGYLSS